MSTPYTIFKEQNDAVSHIADIIEKLILDETKATVTLGLATGATPIPLYRELIKRHREKQLSFQKVVSFNLDEYSSLPPSHAESYWHFMQENLFRHIDIKSENIHLPSGVVPAAEINNHCQEYEQKISAAGGIDLQILGIGRTGHIGFNEPGSPKDSRTRQIALDAITRQDAAPAFGGLEQVPTHAITMGCGTILSAKQIFLLAWGNKKADIVQRAIQGEITAEISASFLQEHPNACFILDQAAASLL